MDATNTYQKRTHPINFTLIELLVVIAIISVLLTILLPALKSAKDKAKEIFCVNNCKGTAMQTFLYANDYDGFAPPPGGNNPAQTYPNFYLQWTTGVKYHRAIQLVEPEYWALGSLRCPVRPTFRDNGALNYYWNTGLYNSAGKAPGIPANSLVMVSYYLKTLSDYKLKNYSDSSVPWGWRLGQKDPGGALLADFAYFSSGWRNYHDNHKIIIAFEDGSSRSENYLNPMALDNVPDTSTCMRLMYKLRRSNNKRPWQHR